MRYIVLSSGVTTTLAGQPTSAGYADGAKTAALFNSPWGVAMNALGTLAVVVRKEVCRFMKRPIDVAAAPITAQADTGNQLIRAVSVASGVVSTLAGTYGVPWLASSTTDIPVGDVFNSPTGVTMDAAGTFILVVRSQGLLASEE